MVGDVVLHGASIGTVIRESDSNLEVYNHLGRKELWSKSNTQVVQTARDILTAFEKEILYATRNNSDS